MTTRILGPIYKSSMFTWQGNEGSTFISDFGPKAEVWGRVFADACDEGFRVLDEKTGKEEVFIYASTIRGSISGNESPEIQGWNFYSYAPGRHDYTGKRIVIYND